MTHQLILLFPGPKVQPCFDLLAEEFGEHATNVLYHFLAERLLTESFPIHSDYRIRIYSYLTHEMFNRHFEARWDHDPLAKLQSPAGTLSAIFEASIKDPDVEKVLFLLIGNMIVDEDQISNWFAKITPDHLICRIGSDHRLLTLGLHRNHDEVIQRLNYLESEILDRIELRCDHFGKEFTQIDTQIVPTNLSELSDFRQALPQEHFIAKKIDQLVLGKLESEKPERARTLQINMDASDLEE